MDFCAWLEPTDLKMRPHAPACLEQLIGLGSELQLPGEASPSTLPPGFSYHHHAYIIFSSINAA